MRWRYDHLNADQIIVVNFYIKPLFRIIFFYTFLFTHLYSAMEFKEYFNLFFVKPIKKCY